MNASPVQRLIKVAATLTMLVAIALGQSGCAVGKLVGGMASSEEAQRLVETPAKYSGLDNRSVAVIVQTDYSTLFEHPGLVTTVTGGVTARIGKWVHNVQVFDPQQVLNWQYRTPQWAALPLGEIATQLNVDRVVFIDILEYRLHPPGNRYLWDGEAVARVGIIERDGIDPDAFSDTFDIVSRFPDMEGVGIESADRSQIETGLLSDFVKRNAWLFHLHYEPKYPDKYRPGLDTKDMQELKRATGS
jgi:hypothetical protein